MKKVLVVVLLMSMAISVVAQMNTDKLSWWKEAKFGLFIHGEFIPFLVVSIMVKTMGLASGS